MKFCQIRDQGRDATHFQFELSEFPDLSWFREHGFGRARKLQKKEKSYTLCHLTQIVLAQRRECLFSSWGMPRHEMRDFLQQQVNGQRERATWNHGKRPARHKKPQLLAHLCNSATSKAESTCCKFWPFTSRWFHLLASPVLFEQGSKYQLHSLLHKCVHEQLLSCWMNMCCVREQFNEKLRVNSVHSCKN